MTARTGSLRHAGLPGPNVRWRATVARSIGFIVLCLVGLLPAAGCGIGGPSPELESLRKEKLASASFEGLRQVRKYETDAQASNETITGKTVDAKIARVLRPEDPALLPEYLRQVVAVAKADGWKQRFSDPRGFTGRKQLAGGVGQVDVVIGPCDSHQCLFVYLTLPN